MLNCETHAMLCILYCAIRTMTYLRAPVTNPMSRIHHYTSPSFFGVWTIIPKGFPRLHHGKIRGQGPRGPRLRGVSADSAAFRALAAQQRGLGRLRGARQRRGAVPPLAGRHQGTAAGAAGGQAISAAWLWSGENMWGIIESILHIDMLLEYMRWRYIKTIDHTLGGASACLFDVSVRIPERFIKFLELFLIIPKTLRIIHKQFRTIPKHFRTIP